MKSAPFNKGRTKVYLGVPGNLVAYACRLSFQKGFTGFVSFHSRTKLIDHYIKTLGAYHFGGPHSGASVSLVPPKARSNVVASIFFEIRATRLPILGNFFPFHIGTSETLAPVMGILSDKIGTDYNREICSIFIV